MTGNLPTSRRSGPRPIDPNAERITLVDLRKGLTANQRKWLSAQLDVDYALAEMVRIAAKKLPTH